MSNPRPRVRNIMFVKILTGPKRKKKINHSIDIFPALIIKPDNLNSKAMQGLSQVYRTSYSTFQNKNWKTIDEFNSRFDVCTAFKKIINNCLNHMN